MNSTDTSRAPRGPLTTCTFEVGGMDCSSCAQNVEKALRSLEGVEEVRADVIGERVTVRYSAGSLARGDLYGAVRRVGYRVPEAERARREIFEVQEMDSADVVQRIEAVVGRLPGVNRLGFDIVGRRLTVEGDVPVPRVERAFAQLGMRARLVRATDTELSWWQRRGRLVLAILSGILWATSLAAGSTGADEGVTAALAIGAIVAGGWYIVPRGIRAMMNRALDMNFLMSIAAFGALIIGEYGEAATAMFLFAVAQLLEAYSMDRARNAIRALMDLSPAEAAVLRDGGETRVPIDQVAVGEIVVVRPGEKVPVDGTVTAGRSAVNQAPITGESIPVEKEPGAEVFAGTLNGEGVLEIRSSKPASDSTLARIIHSVEEAQSTRAPSQAFVDRFARIYTPAVVIVAALVFITPPLLGLGTWGDWFYRALVLLVVACPCALVISTPVTVVSALAGAARRGILIKGGLHLENAGRARVVALDKTGTVTVGEPTVVDVVTFDGVSSNEVVGLAASAESFSEHPLARAILRHARAEGIGVEPARDTRAEPGRGVRAHVNGSEVFVGSERLFGGRAALPAEMARTLDAIEASGRTAVLVGTVEEGGTVQERSEQTDSGGSTGPFDSGMNGSGTARGGPPNGADPTPEFRSEISASEPRILGAIAIADRIRPHVADAIQALHDAGIEHTVMLTGDNRATAKAVAEEVGVDDYRAELLPEDKVTAVGTLRDEYGHVLMVGDGINDAPALAAAEVGVAMGSAGTDVALETADIALMADDLSHLATTIRLARKAEGIIRANIAFALVTKAVFVALAVAGVATLWMAVFADMGASLLVIGNGLRALRE